MEPSFRFGVATADHQCEAYTGADDVRDVWERVRGLTPRGRATDFWNRYREDVDLAKGLGCRIFRLSLSWARLEPEPGSWDDAAFAHYRDVLEYLRAPGMSSVVTLHHNTWPLHVQAAGEGAGMLDAGFPGRVARYAAQVAQRLGDLIDYYVTVNEPNQAGLRLHQGLLDARIPHAAGPAAVRDRRAADGRRTHANTKPLSRARASPRGNSSDPSAGTSRRQPANPGVAALAPAHRRSQRDAR